jgi:hypothetical protein
MNRTLLVCLLVGLAIAGSVGYGGREDRALAQANKPPETRHVPPRFIFYSLDQKDTNLLSLGENDKECQVEMRLLFKGLAGQGPSNVFLVRGDSVAEAVEGSWRGFCRNESADSPISGRPFSKSEDFWLVAYLGTMGSHGEWMIKGAEVTENRIRLSYERRKPGGVVFDMHPYLAWVPLGTLKPGSYAVELFERTSEQVMLMRRVTIPAKEKQQ